MTDASLALLSADDLVRLAGGPAAPAPAACAACAALVCPGWESLPTMFDKRALRRTGTLRQPGDDEPTLQEYHPAGTHAWSVDAPIAPAFHPYNRCDVWQCAACARPFLRYTEYGGYYEDERIRALQAGLVVDAAAGSAEPQG